MSAKIVVGLDGSDSAGRALAHAAKLAGLIGDCEIIAAHVVDWSPFTLQTAEENAERHKRCEQEIAEATRTVLDPVLQDVRGQGLRVRGVVEHGQVAEVLNQIASEHGADHIVIGRSAGGGLAERLFGSTAESIVRNAIVPVTVVG